MATATKTITENQGSSYKSTWTVSMAKSNFSVSGSTFSVPYPSVTAKYVYSGKAYANVEVFGGIRIGGTAVSGTDFTAFRLYSAMASGTNYQIPTIIATSKTANTSTFWNSSNKTTRTISAVLRSSRVYFESWKSETTQGGITVRNWDNAYESTSPYDWSFCDITLNAPPTVTLGTPTYANPHYNGFGSYSVPMNELVAQYGGDIKTAKLTVGSASATKTYSTNTVTNDTISVVPTSAGTFTPTLVVTDSRGQTTTKTLTAITVNQYVAPSVSFDVFRSDSVGVRDDEGAYGLITATINYTSAVAHLTQPVIKIDGTVTNNVTWYSAYNSSTGVSSAISDWTAIASGATVYGLINGSFTTSQSYVIGMTETDTEGGTSSNITQTLSTAFYTIDVQAGGKEIAFGATANDDLTNYPDGLFKCAMDAVFKGWKIIEYDVANGSSVNIPIASASRGFFFIASYGTNKTAIYAVGANSSGSTGSNLLAAGTGGSGVTLTNTTNNIKVANSIGAQAAIFYLTT